MIPYPQRIFLILWHVAHFSSMMMFWYIGTDCTVVLRSIVQPISVITRGVDNIFSARLINKFQGRSPWWTTTSIAKMHAPSYKRNPNCSFHTFFEQNANVQHRQWWVAFYGLSVKAFIHFSHRLWKRMTLQKTHLCFGPCPYPCAYPYPGKQPRWGKI